MKACRLFNHFKIRHITVFIVFLGCIKCISYSQTPNGCGEGKVYICHKGKNTLCVSENAVQAHLNHGDYLGTCFTGNCSVTCTGGEISCVNPVVRLNAISNVPEVVYSWMGPDGFASDLASPTVSIPGMYTVTITDTVSGCTSAASTTVTSDTIHPDATATVNNRLTCSDRAVTITGNSSTPGIIFTWSGPDDFLSNARNSVTTLPGEYTLVATNPGNGCSSVAKVLVDSDTTSPADVVMQISGSLTCSVKDVLLSASSTNVGVFYNWSGPERFGSDDPVIDVQNPGIYTVTITDPTNGCRVRKTIDVPKNITAPSDVNASASGKLTCKDTLLTLTGASSTSAAVYSWFGPKGFTSVRQNPVVHNIGMYHLKVTSITNGCSTEDSVFVLQDTIHPGSLLTNVSGVITGNNPVATLNGSSSDNDIHYSWKGPHDFTASGPQIFTNKPGSYILIATNPLNGCSDTIMVEVEADSSGTDSNRSATSIIQQRFAFYRDIYPTDLTATVEIKNPSGSGLRENIFSVYADDKKG
jgi:hypothetical protein